MSYLEPAKEELMAVELEDLRTKVPKDCLQVLRAISAATGDDIATISRQALIEFAKRQAHVAMMVNRFLEGEGDDGARAGKGGE